MNIDYNILLTIALGVLLGSLLKPIIIRIFNYIFCSKAISGSNNSADSGLRISRKKGRKNVYIINNHR